MSVPITAASLAIPPIPLLATLAPDTWAEATFGDASLGDPRRTRRLVRIAAALATQPDASLPHQLGDPAALKATYRLFDAPSVSFDAVLAPHLTQTRAAANAEPVVLLVQDTTELDFTAHPATTGLGPIGNGQGRGFHLQTVLAVRPHPRLPLGVMAAVPWLRQPAPRRNETSARRAKRDRESDIWGQLVRQIGALPAETRWVHVADRAADCFTFFTACHETHTDVLVRVVHERCATDREEIATHLLDALRAQPAVDHRPLAIPARTRHGRHPAQPARKTEVAVRWTALTLTPPTNWPRNQPTPAPIPVWAVRVWEDAPDPTVPDPVEWLLVTTVPVETVDDAWARRDWYAARWMIEDFHQCLKTGCHAEQTQRRERDRLWGRLAILLPLAARLLLLREAMRETPDAPATAVGTPRMLQVTAARTRQPVATTVAHFAAQVARLGGHQGRNHDGPPGWRTLWRGWWEVQTLMAGVDLAASLPDP